MFRYQMQRITLIALLIATPILMFSQQRYEKHIGWKGVEKSYYGSTSFNIISPTGINFAINEEFLPVVSDIVYLSGNINNVNVEILETQFEELTNDEIMALPQLGNISDQLTINSGVSYARKKPMADISFIPIRKNQNTGKFEKLTFIKLDIQTIRSKKVATIINKSATSSALASGKWVKIAISKDGIYKLSNQELQDMGFSGVNSIKLFGNKGGILPLLNAVEAWDDLKEMAIERNSDHILFYASGPHRWNYNTTYEMFIQNLHDSVSKIHLRSSKGQLPCCVNRQIV